MAKIEFTGLPAYGETLEKLLQAAEGDELLADAVRAGAGPVADRIRDNLERLPEDNFRFLEGEDIFTGLPAEQKKDLLDSLGIAAVSRDRNGVTNAKIGFDGYGSHPTEAYPRGLPNPLLARAVESGSSVRQKTPFVRPAVRATTKVAILAMDKSIDENLKKIFK